MSDNCTHPVPKLAYAKQNQGYMEDNGWCKLHTQFTFSCDTCEKSTILGTTTYPWMTYPLTPDHYKSITGRELTLAELQQLWYNNKDVFNAIQGLDDLKKQAMLPIKTDWRVWLLTKAIDKMQSWKDKIQS